MDVPIKYYAHVGVITFSNFNLEVARIIFVNDQRSELAWESMQIFIANFYNLVCKNIEPPFVYRPSISDVSYMNCEIKFIKAPDDSGNEQTRGAMGLVIHESETEGINI